MIRLNPVEQECKDAFIVLLDLMSPGHPRLGSKTQIEVLGMIRTALVHLTNREYGCASGKHAGACPCKEPS